MSPIYIYLNKQTNGLAGVLLLAGIVSIAGCSMVAKNSLEGQSTGQPQAQPSNSSTHEVHGELRFTASTGSNTARSAQETLQVIRLAVDRNGAFYNQTPALIPLPIPENLVYSFFPNSELASGNLEAHIFWNNSRISIPSDHHIERAGTEGEATSHSKVAINLRGFSRIFSDTASRSGRVEMNYRTRERTYHLILNFRTALGRFNMNEIPLLPDATTALRLTEALNAVALRRFQIPNGTGHILRYIIPRRQEAKFLKLQTVYRHRQEECRIGGEHVNEVISLSDQLFFRMSGESNTEFFQHATEPSSRIIGELAPGQTLELTIYAIVPNTVNNWTIGETVDGEERYLYAGCRSQCRTRAITYEVGNYGEYKGNFCTNNGIGDFSRTTTEAYYSQSSENAYYTRPWQCCRLSYEAPCNQDGSCQYHPRHDWILTQTGCSFDNGRRVPSLSRNECTAYWEIPSDPRIVFDRVTGLGTALVAGLLFKDAVVSYADIEYQPAHQFDSIQLENYRVQIEGAFDFDFLPAQTGEDQ